MDDADEPIDGEVDMAVVSHGIRRFGPERKLEVDLALEEEKEPGTTKKKREAKFSLENELKKIGK